MVLNNQERCNIYSFFETETDFIKDKTGRYSFDLYDDQLYATYKRALSDKEKYKERILEYQRKRGLNLYYRGQNSPSEQGINLDSCTYKELRQICIDLGLLKHKKVKKVEPLPEQTKSEAKIHDITPKKVIISNTVYDDDGDVLPVQLYTKRDLAYCYGLQITEEDEYMLLEQGIKIEDPESNLPEIEELKSIIIAILLKYKATNRKKERYTKEDLKLMNLSELEYVLLTAQTAGQTLPSYLDLEHKVLYKK